MSDGVVSLLPWHYRLVLTFSILRCPCPCPCPSPPPPPHGVFRRPDAWPVVVDDFVEMKMGQRKALQSETDRP